MRTMRGARRRLARKMLGQDMPVQSTAVCTGAMCAERRRTNIGEVRNIEGKATAACRRICEAHAACSEQSL